MIVKSMRHKNASFDYIVEYLYEGMPKNPDLRWALYHNLSRGIDTKSIIQEFEENAEYLKLRSSLSRKKIYKYHEVMAFSIESTPFLTPQKLKNLALEYIKLRDPESASIALCVPHIEKGRHVHLHLLFSSNFIRSNKSSDLRMDKAMYYRIRREIETIMLKLYPELYHSVVYLTEKEIEKLLPKEYQQQRVPVESQKKKDFGNQSKKKQLAGTIQSLLDISTSLLNFTEAINNIKGLSTYSRNNKLSGVIMDGKKYRFSTLGIQLLPENLKVLERMGELDELEKNQKSNKLKDFER